MERDATCNRTEAVPRESRAARYCYIPVPIAACRHSYQASTQPPRPAKRAIARDLKARPQAVAYFAPSQTIRT